MRGFLFPLRIPQGVRTAQTNLVVSETRIQHSAYTGVCNLSLVPVLSWLFPVSLCPGCQGLHAGKGEIATDLLKLVCAPCALALALVNSPLPPCCSQESRDGRVDSWRNFQANTKGKKEKKNRTFLRPPKVKMEQRE